MKKIIAVIFFTVGWALSAIGDVPDTTDKSLKDFLKRGTVTCNMRKYFMATNNYGPLTDYYSLAVGAGIGYQTPEFKGFTAGFSGFFLFNVISNDLGAIDPLGRGCSRYELGNFDMQNPYNRNNLERLESLFVKYRFRKSSLTLGRQNLLTPFINPQDGRMRPSLQDGLWLDIRESNRYEVRAGFIYGMSPRSSVNWFTVGRSIGVYPVGVNSDGSPSGYRDSIKSDFVLIGNILFRPAPQVNFNYWFYHTDNVFNLHFIQTDYLQPIRKANYGLISGTQFGYLASNGNGGHSNPSKAFMLPNHTSGFFSSRVGFWFENIQTTLNYTHIFDQDRFVFPREWGIEPFYTFMPRERNEGTANTHAISLKNEIRLNDKTLAGIAVGYFKTADVLNFRQNKYGLPSYNQLNIFYNHVFGGALTGLKVQALYVYKGLVGDTYDNLRYVFNRVMMSNYNLILNYTL